MTKHGCNLPGRRGCRHPSSAFLPGCVMTRTFAQRAAGLLTAGILVGCSAPVRPLAADALEPGTAVIVVGDSDPERTTAVHCVAAGPLTTIAMGDEKSGMTTVVSTADGLSAKSVQINSVAGFTGSAYPDLIGRVDVALVGGTYSISGAADGSNADAPSFTASRPFSFRVAC